MIPTEIANELHLLISVIGPHAGEDEATYFPRKLGDIGRAGYTLWRMSSRNATPRHVQELSLKREENPSAELWCCFVDPARPGGAADTSVCQESSETSEDRVLWLPWPANLSKVTGRLPSTGTMALRFDRLVLAHRAITIPLGHYVFLGSDQPVKMILGASTVCASLRPAATSSPQPGTRTDLRRVVAIARLGDPWMVWIR